ncbi:hypothetical protein QBC34DRAFT_191122 [Podospora aff. communis PSN243]|uniref:GDP/GTP exchange factor Sec2 N-terminal domain-containing protein n=1 Tax=Podospora aff. communis PSN243 TaxID=3040156 RepID=A0AAV9GZL2_9PEZI|nr:hypothetical protein QBC34DRAFT_191122 [Podospora aff. communis PSN243]
MLDSIAAIHSRLHGLTQGTLRNPELPKSYRDGFQVDTQHLTRSLFELANKIESRGQAMASLEKENVELRKTNNSLETTLTEAIEEVSRLNHELVDEAKKSHRFQDALTMAEQKARQDQYKISDLEDRCTRLNEQVDNKRSLWMQVHTDPKDRARAMSQHAQSQKSASIYGQDSPMEPPSISGSWRPRITGGPGPMSNTHQPSTSRTIGHRTSQSQLRLAPPRLPIGSGRGSQFGTSSVHSSIGNLSDVRPRSVLGSQYSGRQMDIARRSDLSLSFGNLSARDQESDRKTSLFSRRLPDDFPATTEAGSPVKKNPLSKEWEGKFTKLWTMIFGFCGGYASGPSKKDVPTHLKSKAPELWKELCLSISPTNEQRAAERIAYSLFRDPNARKYLTQRYLTQFLVALAFDVSWYLGFSDDLDEEIRELAAELKANGK